MHYDIASFFIRLCARLFFHLRVSGKECIPRKQPFILASNHISYLDPPLVGALCCPVHLRYLGKEELFRNKIFAFILTSVGVFPLRRGSSDIRAIRQALVILKEGPLLIFPQGTRGASSAAPLEGVGFLHRKSKAPVIAARVRGTDVVLPKGASFFRRGSLSVCFAPVDTIQPEDSDQDIARKVMEKIENL